MQHTRQLEVIADLWGGRIRHVLEVSVSYSSILNLCPSVLRLCSTTSQQAVLDFALRSSHGGLAWVCWKPKAPSQFCQLIKPVCSGFGSLFAGSGEGSNSRSPFFLSSYREEQLAVEGGAGRHVSWGHADVPKGGAVAGRGRQIRLHRWEWAQKHKTNSSAAAVRQLLSERTLDPALIQWLQRTERKCPTTSFKDWNWMTGPSQSALTRMRKQEGADDWQRLPDVFKSPRLVTWAVATGVERKEEVLKEPEERMKDK